MKKIPKIIWGTIYSVGTCITLEKSKISIQTKGTHMENKNYIWVLLFIKLRK